MTRKKSDDAVSPVIGVMLMLVVVIIVAAVVITFATGMTDNVEAAPIAKLDVEIISDQEVYGYQPGSSGETYSTKGTAPTLHLTHVSGDPLDTADLKLTFTWECDTHGRHTSTYQAGTGAMDDVTGLWEPSGYGPTKEPLYINYGGMKGAYFGNHILKRGETMMAFDLHFNVGQDSVNPGSPVMDALFNNGNIISEGEVIQNVEMKLDKCPLCGEEDPEDSVYCGKKDEFIISGCPNCGGDPWNLEQTGEGSSEAWYCNPEYGGCGYKFKAYGYKLFQYSAGIMACLPEGTAVNVMISHIPSGQIIYDEKVFVE